MSLTKSIYDRSVFFFITILLFSFWGFWVTYFARPPETIVTWEHVHGMAMYAWVAMLIIQSSLIRFDRRSLHRLIGRFSYLLVPVIFISTLYVGHHRLGVRGMSDEGVFVLGLQFLGLIPFTLFYCLAIINRRKPDVHARWMVCTGVTLIDPVFARIIGIHLIQVPFESGIVNAITFGSVALIMLLLTVLDYRDSGRRDVFLPAMLIMAIPQFLFLLAWDGPVWRGFVSWYASLPLG